MKMGRLLPACLLAAVFCLPAGLLWPAEPRGESPEMKAVSFLSREVPGWSVKNGCFSCHNNGDGARALYRALTHGYKLPAEALATTNGWLSKPDQWDRDAGNAEFKDARLARIQFAAALTEGVEARQIKDGRALADTAARLAKDQAEDGSWPLVTGGAVAAPATYGPALATHLARRILMTADPKAYREQLEVSQRWLEQARLSSVVDTAAIAWALAKVDSPAAREQRDRAIDRLRRAESSDGGWGPYVVSQAEGFDTALVLLALKEAGGAELRPLIQRGRAWLIAHQQDDGSWPATTRPAGIDSYAEYISTTAWALQALLETRDP